MHRPGSETSLLSAFAAAALVVTLLAGAAWKLSSEANEASRWVAHTHEVLDNLARVSADSLQIELSTQGFRISGDVTRLAERDVAVANRGAALERIRRLTADNASQQERWTRLRKVIDERLAISRRTEQLRKTQGLAAASAYVARAPLKETRKRLIQLLDEMEAEERRLLEERSTELTQARATTVTVGIAAAVLLVALLLASFFLIRRQIRTAEASRRETEDQRNVYWSLLDAISDGMKLSGSDGVLRHVNRAFSDHFALGDPAGYVGQPARVFDERLASRLADPAKFLAEMERLWRDPEVSGQFELGTRDGQRQFLFFSMPVRDATGGAVGRALACRDVTREREVERMKSEFVATVSHELRTPLASLLGFSELMLTRQLPEEKNKQFLEVIHKESQRLNTLIDDFLDLQRIESGRVAYTLEPLDIAALVREVAALLSSHARHPLHLDLPAGLPKVMGDHDRLKQVLQNLVSNAVKFSPQGGEIALTVRVAEDGRVEISVQDHGLGIPPEAMPKLFGKFYRVDATDRREIGGTGLGLALCKEIVGAHHGRLWAESRLGEGSTFRFTLPAQPAAAPAPAVTVPGEGYALVVEDDTAFAALVREHLGETGLSVRVEPSAEGALAAARAATPALVVLDIHLAGTMDGWDLLLEMKADRKLAHVPVIITTITDQRSKGLALGVADYLIKPFPMESLVEGIRRFFPEPAGKRVLVVDDDANFRAAAVSMVQVELHCKTEEAANGREALETIRRRLPDLVILDLLMPELDGFAVLDALRARTETASLPVLVVTGKDLMPWERERLKQGLARVLTKAEYSHHKLLTLVRELLGRKSP